MRIKLHKLSLLLLGLSCLGLIVLLSKPAAASNPTNINFQGKVVNSDGTNVSNGTYSFVFRIYNSANPTINSSCSTDSNCRWEETQSSVTVTNGVFQVELGSVCGLTSGSCNNSSGGPINWTTTNSLYLTMKFGSDTSGTCNSNPANGFMCPAMHITSVPFAFNADKLGGLASSDFIQNNTGSAQSSSSFHIDGTGIADIKLQSPTFDTPTSNTALGIGTTNAAAITLGNTSNSTFLFKPKTSATALVIQNTTPNAVLTVDTSGNQVLIGATGSSGLNGKLIFNSATSSNYQVGITVSGSQAATYTLTLPTSAPSTSNCLKTDASTATLLTFASCGGGGTLAADYNSSGTSGNTITLSSSGGGIIVQDAASTVGTLLQLQSSSSSKYLTLSIASSVPHLEVYGSGGTNYADIYFDDTNGYAVYGASGSNTTRIGTGTGNITFGMTDTANKENHNHTDSTALYNNSDVYCTNTPTPGCADYTFTRNFTTFAKTGGGTATGVSLQGSVLAVQDTSSIDSGGSNSPNVVYINQNTSSATGNLILAQTGGNTDKFKVDTTGLVTSAGGVSIAASKSYTGSGAVTVSSGSSTALTLDGANGTVNLGSNTTSLAFTDATGVSISQVSAQNLTIGNSGGASTLTLQSGTGDIILNAGTNNYVIVGSATSDTNAVFFQLDSDSDFNADEGTCNTTTNQGAMYYNTTSNSIRACINSNWEDLVSTAGLGLQLFGIVPDSGSNPGDLAAVTGAQNGPCKVSVGANTSTISWTACTAYSGGRKILVTAGTQGTSAGTSATIIWQHLCLTGTNKQPALSTIGTESANLSTVSLASVTSPILCLADIKVTNGSAVITGVYDTRTYTTTTKITTSVGTTAPTLSMLTQFSSTKGVSIPMATLNGNNLEGVVVASTGATSTNTINAIVAVSGPAAVKAITGTNVVGAYIFGSATAGYASTVATKPTEGTGTIYNVLGSARTAWTGATACSANADACAGSILTYIDKR